MAGQVTLELTRYGLVHALDETSLPFRRMHNYLASRNQRFLISGKGAQNKGRSVYTAGSQFKGRWKNAQRPFLIDHAETGKRLVDKLRWHPHVSRAARSFNRRSNASSMLSIAARGLSVVSFIQRNSLNPAMDFPFIRAQRILIVSALPLSTIVITRKGRSVNLTTKLNLRLSG